MCWGDNPYSQPLGNGTDEASSIPVQAVGISDAIAIEIGGWQAGTGHTCAVLASGGVVCWGAGGAGQLGNGSRLDSLLPLPVSGITDAVAVAAAGHHTCALLADGGVMCWGDNQSGKLGNGTIDPFGVNPEPLPVMVSGIDDAVAIAVGGADDHQAFSCALLSGGGVSCWGYRTAETGGDSAVPVPVSGIADATAISVGVYRACALRADGQAMCWSGGQEPEAVAGLTDAAAIAAGGDGAVRLTDFACAVQAGDVACWGGGWSEGETPSKVLGIADATAVATGSRHACGLLSDGGVMCWQKGGGIETIAGLVAGGPTGTPVPALTSMTISWDGSSCTFETGSVAGAGNTLLTIDNQTDPEISGTLMSIEAGHTLDEAAAFLDGYDGISDPPDWLAFVAEVTDDPFGSRDDLVDLTPGTYGAFCFDPGLAGYVVADGQLVIEP
jgi:hypothetical protein